MTSSWWKTRTPFRPNSIIVDGRTQDIISHAIDLVLECCAFGIRRFHPWRVGSIFYSLFVLHCYCQKWKMKMCAAAILMPTIQLSSYSWTTPGTSREIWTCTKYIYLFRQVSKISCTWVGNEIVDHSDVVGASPVGAAPTTSSFSTEHMASIYCVKTTASRVEKHLSFGIWCDLY